MPSLDDVYRKFGEASEASQLLETELGTHLLASGLLNDRIMSPTFKVDREKATALLGDIDRQTLGQLIRNTRKHRDDLTQLEPLLARALEERNRLSHHFFRDHNFRRNTEEGRLLMLNDLDSIHNVVLDAYKAVMLFFSGIDLDELVKNANGVTRPN